MPKHTADKPIRRLTIELPESEYGALENYCRDHQQTKRQVIRLFIRRLMSRQAKP